MKLKMKHLQSLVAVALCVIFAMSFVNCSDSKDDEPEQFVENNAKGIYIFGTEDLDIDNINLWINEYSIYTYTYQDIDEIDLSINKNKSIPYYNLSMNIVYELLSEEWGVEINANTDLSKFNPNPTNFINYIKNNKSKYKYIATPYNGDYILFNRTSSANY